MKSTILIAVGCILASSALTRAERPLSERWNYIRFNMADDAACEKLIGLLRLSKECGCTHILLSESRMARLCGPQTEEYYRNVKRVLEVAKELDLRIIPMVFHIGYGGRYLYFDGNLMAGLPVKDAPFVVKGGVAEPDPAASSAATRRPAGG
jgi:hypothetical protein